MASLESVVDSATEELRASLSSIAETSSNMSNSASELHVSQASMAESPSKLPELGGTSRAATIRLMSDLREITADPPDGISAAVMNDSNLYEWRASITGPEDTPWEGGIYALVLEFDGSYPEKPPKIRFVCDMWHPNIYADGGICLDVMKTLWRPVFTVAAILQSIQSLLADPNPASPANPAAASMFNSDPKGYRRKVRQCAERSIEIGFDD